MRDPTRSAARQHSDAPVNTDIKGSIRQSDRQRGRCLITKHAPFTPLHALTSPSSRLEYHLTTADTRLIDDVTMYYSTSACTAICKLCNVQHRVSLCLIQQQPRWIGHVIRMPENQFLRKLFYEKLVRGSRSQESKKKRFKDRSHSILKQCTPH